MLETEDDRDVCQKLYEENKQRLFRIANKILHNTADAEDAVQICFSKIIGDFDDRYSAIFCENLASSCSQLGSKGIISAAAVSYSSIKSEYGSLLLMVLLSCNPYSSTTREMSSILSLGPFRINVSPSFPLFWLYSLKASIIRIIILL